MRTKTTDDDGGRWDVLATARPELNEFPQLNLFNQGNVTKGKPVTRSHNILEGFALCQALDLHSKVNSTTGSNRRLIEGHGRNPGAVSH